MTLGNPAALNAAIKAGTPNVSEVEQQAEKHRHELARIERSVKRVVGLVARGPYHAQAIRK